MTAAEERGTKSSHPPFVEHRPEGLSLVVDGAVQSIEVGDTPLQGYWPALVPNRRPRSALILGLGAGTAAHLLLRKWGEVAITGVDDDPAVLDLGRSHFGLDRLPLTIVQADAHIWVRACRAHFDLIIVDLYRGEAATSFLGNRAFIRAVRQLVTPGGTTVWNLHRDRRSARLRHLAGRSMLPDREVLAGLNLVQHYCRRARVLRLSLPA